MRALPPPKPVAEDAPPPPPAPESPFHLVATGTDLRLFSLGSEVFLTDGCARGGPFASARLSPNGIELTAALTEGWSYCVFCHCDFLGSYPEHVYRNAPGSEPDGCTTQELQQKRGSKWVRLGGPRGNIRVTEWSKGRRLVAGQDCGGTLELAVLDTKDRFIRPTDAPVIGRRLAPPGFPPGPMEGFASFPSGEVLLLLGPIADMPSRIVVWRDGKPKPSTFVLPSSIGELENARFVALGPAEVLLTVQADQGPKLLGFDGTKWAELPVTGPKRIDVMRPARDGGVWLAGSDPTLWHRSPRGAWTAFRLPEGASVVDVVEPTPGDVFVASPRALYRNRAANPPVRIETDCPDVFQGDSPDYDLARCNPRLVPLGP